MFDDVCHSVYQRQGKINDDAVKLQGRYGRVDFTHLDEQRVLSQEPSIKCPFPFLTKVDLASWCHSKNHGFKGTGCVELDLTRTTGLPGEGDGFALGSIMQPWLDKAPFPNHLCFSSSLDVVPCCSY